MCTGRALCGFFAACLDSYLSLAGSLGRHSGDIQFTACVSHGWRPGLALCFVNLPVAGAGGQHYPLGQPAFGRGIGSSQHVCSLLAPFRALGNLDGGTVSVAGTKLHPGGT